MYEVIYKLPNLIKTSIIPRPINGNKSPYLIYLNYYINGNNICHSKAQKCCGLLAPEKELYITQNPKNSKIKSLFKAQIAICNDNNGNEQLIGINPDNGEIIAKSILNNNLLPQLYIKKGSLKSQYKFIKDKTKGINEKLENNERNHSIFDFTAINNKTGKQMIIEVKSVVLADYENITEKEEKINKKKNIDISIGKKYNEKIAIFPKGFRAKKSDTISQRAIDHMKHLSKIAKETNIETYILFVVMRDDVKELQPYIDDPLFVNTLKEIKENNVNLLAISTKFNSNGEINLINNNLPIIIP